MSILTFFKSAFESKPPQPPRFCIDCKHCIKPKNNSEEYSLCGHKSASIEGSSYYVNGTVSDPFHCSTMRSEVGWCGPKGSLWQPK